MNGLIKELLIPLILSLVLFILLDQNDITHYQHNMMYYAIPVALILSYIPLTHDGMKVEENIILFFVLFVFGFLYLKSDDLYYKITIRRNIQMSLAVMFIYWLFNKDNSEVVKKLDIIGITFIIFIGLPMIHT
jgi:hypothetical protein